MQIYLQIIAAIWIAFMAILFLPAIREGAPVEQRSASYIRWSFIVALVVIVFVVVLGTFEPGALILRVVPDSPIAGITGIVLTLAGLGFSGWARRHLGRYWSSMVEVKVGHRIIRTGPYAFVRNPMYTGILIVFAGAAIAIGEVLAFVALGIGLVSIWVKIKAEEQILTEKFGGEYLQYKREVRAAIIPWVL
jgi:protein-S-isoprenylcysteine O-methyltransferase Ste14